MKSNEAEVDFNKETTKSHPSQWLFFKNFFIFYLKLRFKKLSSIIVPIGFLIATFIIYVFEEPTLQYADYVPQYNIDMGSFSNDYAPVIGSKKTFDMAYVYMYPKTFITDIFDAENFYRYTAFDDKKEFTAAMDNSDNLNQGVNIFYDLEKMETEKTINLYYSNTYELSDFEFEKAFMRSFLKRDGLDFDILSTTIDEPYASKIFSTFTPQFLCICLPFIFLFSFSEVINFLTTKMFVLLSVSGAYEITIWGVFILIELIYTVLFTVIMDLIMINAKCLKGADFLLTWVPLLFTALGVYSLMLACIPFIKKHSHFVMLIVLIVLVGLFTASLQYIIDKNDPLARNALHIAAFFDPFIGISGFYSNIDTLNCYNRSLSSETMKEGEFMSGNEILVANFCCILIYSFLFTCFELFLPRAAGSAPIGYKNIFNASRWKALFSKATIKESTDDDKPFIEVKNISKTYSSKFGKTHALNDESFTVGRNEVIVLIGPNGCGKSTLLNSMSGTCECDKGELFINGQKADLGFKEMQLYLGITFQDNILFDGISVKQHLEFFGKIRGMLKYELSEEINRIVSALDMHDILDMKAETLSGGQKRKLCIAAAFIGSPPIVILDEPTAGIDVNARQLIWKAIASFKRSACFVTSHSLEEAESVASRMFIMKHGNIIFQDTVSKLRYSYHCGYRLAPVGEDVKIDQILEICNSFIEGSTIDDENTECILLPISDNIPNLFDKLEEKKEELGANNYTVTVEQLEHVILRIIADEE